MPIDDTLARWSDISFETAFVVYLLAAIAFLAQLATTRSAELHNTERLRARIIAATSTTPGMTAFAGQLVVSSCFPVRVRSTSKRQRHAVELPVDELRVFPNFFSSVI